MLKYISGSTNEVIILSQEKIRAHLKTAGFYSHKWEVDETKLNLGSKINAIKMQAKEYVLKIDFLGNKNERAENAELFHRLIDSDVIQKIPGKLYYKDCYIECYILSESYGRAAGNFRAIQNEVRIYAPYPFWISEQSYHFNSTGIISSNNKTYPTRYGYRYANGLNASYIINPHFTDSNFKMIIYGPVINPQINIGSNRYLVYIVLEEGEYLEINSRTGTIEKVLPNGERVNAFHNRQKGTKFFKKISPGRQSISFSSKMIFDLFIYEERSEPKW